MASRNSYCDFNLNGGKLLTAGFEEVNSLPGTNLFVGRQVTYNGQLYVYNGSAWINVNAPYEANLAWGGRNIQAGASPIDACLNPNSGNNIFGFFPAENIVIERSEDSGQTWSSSEISDDKKILLFTKNTELTVGNDMVRITLDCNGILYGTLIKIIISMSTGLAEDCCCKVQGLTYYKSANGLTGDADYVNIAESQLIGWTNDNTINFSPVTVGYHSMTNNSHYRYLRFIFGSRSGHNLYIIKSIYGYTYQTYRASEFQKTGKLYTYDAYKNAYFPSSVVSKERVNFDANIEPTQTGIVAKTSVWLWQYYAQSIAWLMANHLPLSGGTLSGDINAPHFIVPNGTAAQFLKADGSLDSNSYTLHTDLNAVKNNAWKVDIANPECETVVIALQPGQGIFEAMEKAGIDYSKSRNIYVDLSAAGEWSGENLFAGYENAPIGVRYHIFLGNVKTAIKLYWASTIESNKLSGNLALTAEYPTAKCEFMRVTDSWTYADWEALIDEVSHVIDTGTASESDNSTLVNYMDNNKIPYSKTMKGALVNITALLAALAGSK